MGYASGFYEHGPGQKRQNNAPQQAKQPAWEKCAQKVDGWRSGASGRQKRQCRDKVFLHALYLSADPYAFANH